MDIKLARLMQPLAEAYDRSETHTARVKVVDVFGSDSSISVEVVV